tara:strand:+ start:787 stop:942 length:156 start_codon:yes stop_codon:yes gene_type:complete
MNLFIDKKTAHKLKLCTKCKKDKPPEGGVEMSQTKWICQACWGYKRFGSRT